MSESDQPWGVPVIIYQGGYTSTCCLTSANHWGKKESEIDAIVK